MLICVLPLLSVPTPPFRGAPRPGQFFDPDPPAPDLPVGAVYLSDTSILHDFDGPDRRDKKDDRPVVIVRSPSRLYPKVDVCVRESVKANRPAPDGVPHAADLDLGLDRPGVWLPRPRWAHPSDFVKPAVKYLGKLSDELVEKIRRKREGR